MMPSRVMLSSTMSLRMGSISREFATGVVLVAHPSYEWRPGGSTASDWLRCASFLGAEARRTAERRGGPLSGSRVVHLGTAPLHSQLQEKCLGVDIDACV